MSNPTPFGTAFTQILPSANDGLKERMAKLEARTLSLEVADDTFLAGSVFSFNGRVGAVSFQLSDITGLAADPRYVLKAGDTMTGPFVVQSQHNALAGLTKSVLVNPTIAPPGAGSSNVQVFDVDYTINATGAQTGTVTGISVVATETSLQGKAHQLLVGVVNGDTRLRVLANGNWAIGSAIGTSDFGADSTGTLLIMTSVAPTADPGTNAFQQWSDAGQWAYRTKVANEGSGQTNLVHNRGFQIAGVGTNYTLTGSTARVDFGTTDADIVLPTAGTYLVQAFVSTIGDALGLGDLINVKLRNITDAADIGSPKIGSVPVASGRLNFALQEIVTVAAGAKTVQIFAFNATAARGVVESTTTTLAYVRLS